MIAPGPQDATSAWLRELLGRDPRQPDLFLAALTHRSATDDNNERLEFLGDAVLGMVIAEELFRRFPDADEGDLSRLRSRLVSAGPLAQIGARIGIGAVLRLGSGELRTGGFRRESILADATEALFGAVYLDGSLAEVRTLVLRLYDAMIAELQPDTELKDSKTRLQELLQGRGEALPGYVLDAALGEPHAQTFEVRCVVHLSGEAQIEAEGSGSSRRRAEQQAAAGMLERLGARWRT
ncbi:MAG TPA: ribonuclease III [Steroidobacteraceae bacterium]|nr:ribonuclease III [Steroidobacteraceae bacterium]